MPEAVIVATGRSPIGRAGKGSLISVRPDDMVGYVVKKVLEKVPELPHDQVEDLICGCGFPQGETGMNVGRLAVFLSGLPNTVPGMTINRFCSSGLQTIAMAAQRVMAGEGEIFVAGGVESISCVQNESNKHMLQETWLLEHKPEIYWTMLETAENVSKRYAISREKQDEYGAQSQQRAAAAAAAGKFDAEIVPMTVTMGVADKESARLFTREATLAADEGIHPKAPGWTDVTERQFFRGAAQRLHPKRSLCGVVAADQQ